jgi:hypothetical protein
MSTVVVGTIQSNSTSPPTFNNTNGTEIGTLCRAFCNFNGTGTVAIRASFNVTSITDNGTGDYTVNFTNALPDANYGNNITGVNDGTNDVVRVTITTTPTTSALRFALSNPVGTPQDSNRVSVAIFR